jgi:hypothetical protein
MNNKYYSGGTKQASYDDFRKRLEDVKSLEEEIRKEFDEEYKNEIRKKIDEEYKKKFAEERINLNAEVEKEREELRKYKEKVTDFHHETVALSRETEALTKEAKNLSNIYRSLNKPKEENKENKEMSRLKKSIRSGFFVAMKFYNIYLYTAIFIVLLYAIIQVYAMHDGNFDCVLGGAVWKAAIVVISLTFMTGIVASIDAYYSIHKDE